MNAFVYLGTAEQCDGSEHAIVSYVCLKGIEAREVSKGTNEEITNKDPVHREPRARGTAF